MKKQIVKVKEFLHLQDVRKRVNDAFAAGKAQDAADAIRAALDELESMEVEVDEDALKEKVLEILGDAEPNSKTEEAIANAIAKRMTAITNTVKAKELPVQVKNQICAAVLRAGSKEEVKNAVNAVLVKNDITGLSFADVIDYTIVENWGDLNPLFAKLHKTFYTKFFYNDDELKTKDIIAKEWTKTNESEKVIQLIAAEGKRITTKYVYKRQQVAQEDLDEIEKAGEQTNFLRFINEELDRMIVNTIVMAILIGDTTNDLGNRLSTFETIGTKTTSDVFTAVKNPAAAGSVKLKDLRLLADAVKNPMMKEKIAIISQDVLTSVAEFKYASGGDVVFHTAEEVAKQIGVDQIIVCDLMGNPAEADDTIYAIVMLPDGYWYNEKNALAVSYPKYENNVMNYQKERNIGGAIHDLYSTAVLRKASI